MYRTEAFVLSRRERKEADYLVTLYTERYGLMSAAAIGIRKPAAKLKGHLEILSRTDIHFVSGQTGYRLIGALLVNPFSRVTESFERRAAAEAAVAIIESAAYGAEADPALWNTVENFFETLNEDSPWDGAQCERLLFWFATRLFQTLGYQISEEEKHSAVLKNLFLQYEQMSARESAENPLDRPLHEAFRAELTRAFQEHLGMNPRLSVV